MDFLRPIFTTILLLTWIGMLIAWSMGFRNDVIPYCAMGVCVLKYAIQAIVEWATINIPRPEW